MPHKKLDGPYFEDEEGCKWLKAGKLPEDIGVLTNFTAQIDAEDVYHDGARTNTVLTISGQMLDKEGKIKKLKPITIDATELKSMSWIAQKWGMGPIVYPMPSAERDISTIMQIVSEPVHKDIFTHTGWTTTAGRAMFLSMSGGITDKGLQRGITVSLPAELQRYSLPDPKECKKEDVHASLSLLKIGPKNVLWPMLLATYRAAIGPADFAIFVAGRTGTFKSELASLMQSHYGVAMNARALPASWNSTGNALQALAYKAKDTLIVIDDYIPVGTGYQVRGLEAKVDEVIRAQGNQAGRSRLTDTSAHQGTMYPRGIICGTGEDIPTGHSIRGRMLISELTPNDIPPKLLSSAQANRPQFSKAMADWISWLALNDQGPTVKELANTYRDQNIGIGHARTPSILGELMATADTIGHWCVARKWLSTKQAIEFVGKAQDAIKQAGTDQKQYLTVADPVQIFCQVIRMMLQTAKAHAKTVNGGVPRDAENYGWTSESRMGETTTYKANGPCIGWLNAEKNEFLFDPNLFSVIKKNSDGRLTATDQTFAKRLKDAGIVTRTEASRERNSVRVTVDGSSRRVIALKLDEMLADDTKGAA